MWAGTGSLSSEMHQHSSPLHQVSLAIFSEIVDIKRQYIQREHPDAIDFGAYSPETRAAFSAAASGADVIFVSFECEPYIDCGKQRRHKDSRSVQVNHTTDAMLDIDPHLALWEQVQEFFRDDPIHGKWTEAQRALAEAMHAYPVQVINDTAAGGTLCRPRGWVFFERLYEYGLLPPWSPSLASLPALRPRAVVDSHPSSSNLWVPGHFILTKQPGSSHAADSPVVVGEVLFPHAESSPALGVAYNIHKHLYKVDAIFADGSCRMMAVHRDSFSQFCTSTLTALAKLPVVQIKYPVYDLNNALLSLRGWGQPPQGNHCLVADKREGHWRPRRTSFKEQWQLVKATWSADRLRESFHRWALLGATHDDIRRASGKSITSAHAAAATLPIATRRLAWAAFVRAAWHPDIPMTHVNAPMLPKYSKRVILLLLDLHHSAEEPHVIVGADLSIPGLSFDDTTRAHESGNKLAQKWCSLLNVDHEPFLAGVRPWQHATLLVFTAPVRADNLGCTLASPRLLPVSAVGLKDLQLAVDLCAVSIDEHRKPRVPRHKPSSSVYKTGATLEQTLAARPVATSTSSRTFQQALDASTSANQRLCELLQSDKLHIDLAMDVGKLQPSTLHLPDVADTLKRWSDRIFPVKLDDVSPAFREAPNPLFTDSSFSLLLYSDECHPPQTQWLPLTPNQVMDPSFKPVTVADLYVSPTTLVERAECFAAIDKDCKAFKLGGSDRKPTAPSTAWSDDTRVAPARGLIFDLRHPPDPYLKLVQFDAPIHCGLKPQFVQDMFPGYPDQELVSHMLYGVRWKAVFEHMQYKLPRHLHSLGRNYSKLEKQFNEREQNGMVSLHDHPPFDPCCYVCMGTTERKDSPEPRLTDNLSWPHCVFLDSSGNPVESHNAATRLHRRLPPNPDERKPPVPSVMTDTCILRHIGDICCIDVYLLKADGAFFFDQFTLANEELHKNVKFLSAMRENHKLGTHVSGKRMGFGGSPASNIGQRLAYLIVVAFCFFMNRLDDPYHATAAPQLRDWLTQRKLLNPLAHTKSPSPDWPGKQDYTRQDKRYAVTMFTDDLIAVLLGADVAARAVTALYLACDNLGVILASLSKAAIGTSMVWTGASFFTMLGITCLPRDKCVTALHRLAKTIAGDLSLKDYEKLVGLLVHCWYLALMSPKLMNHLHDPLTYAKKAKRSMQSKIQPASHPLTLPVWHAWNEVLTTSTGAFMHAAVALDTALPQAKLEINIFGDAFRDPVTRYVQGRPIQGHKAGIGSFMLGYYYHYEVPDDCADVLVTAVLENLALAGNLINMAPFLPDVATKTKIHLHSDSLATALDTPKPRVRGSPAMNFVTEHIHALPVYTARKDMLSISHVFGLGNPGADAASRNEIQRIYLICAALGIRPIRVPVQPEFDALVRSTAAYVRSLASAQSLHKRSLQPGPLLPASKRHLSGTEQSLSDAHSNCSKGDGPTPSPAKTRLALLTVVKHLNVAWRFANHATQHYTFWWRFEQAVGPCPNPVGLWPDSLRLDQQAWYAIRWHVLHREFPNQNSGRSRAPNWKGLRDYYCDRVAHRLQIKMTVLYVILHHNTPAVAAPPHLEPAPTPCLTACAAPSPCDRAQALLIALQRLDLLFSYTASSTNGYYRHPNTAHPDMPHSAPWVRTDVLINPACDASCCIPQPTHREQMVDYTPAYQTILFACTCQEAMHPAPTGPCQCDARPRTALMRGFLNTRLFVRSRTHPAIVLLHACYRIPEGGWPVGYTTLAKFIDSQAADLQMKLHLTQNMLHRASPMALPTSERAPSAAHLLRDQPRSEQRDPTLGYPEEGPTNPAPPSWVIGEQGYPVDPEDVPTGPAPASWGYSDGLCPDVAYFGGTQTATSGASHSSAGGYRYVPWDTTDAVSRTSASDRQWSSPPVASAAPAAQPASRTVFSSLRPWVPVGSSATSPETAREAQDRSAHLGFDGINQEGWHPHQPVVRNVPPPHLLHPRITALPEGALLRSGNNYHPTSGFMEHLHTGEYPIIEHMDVWTVRNASTVAQYDPLLVEGSHWESPEATWPQRSTAHDIRLDVTSPSGFQPWVLSVGEAKQYHRQDADPPQFEFLDDITISVVPLHDNVLMRIDFTNCEPTQVPGDPYQWTVHRTGDHPIINVWITGQPLRRQPQVMVFSRSRTPPPPGTDSRLPSRRNTHSGWNGFGSGGGTGRWGTDTGWGSGVEPPPPPNPGWGGSTAAVAPAHLPTSGYTLFAWCSPVTDLQWAAADRQPPTSHFTPRKPHLQYQFKHRPYTTLELGTDTAMANTPTSASFPNSMLAAMTRTPPRPKRPDTVQHQPTEVPLTPPAAPRKAVPLSAPPSRADLSRTPPSKPPRAEVLFKRSAQPRPTRRTSPRKTHKPYIIRSAVSSAVATNMLTAFDAESPYAIRPRNLESFHGLCRQVVDHIEEGVPSNTAANERSAYDRYWIPFCIAMGTSPERPEYSELTPLQKAAEDKLKALALPWIHARMIGRKQPQADPNSAMNSLRNINRVINRHSDEHAPLKRAMKVLKGMLRKHVSIYGPLQPDRALPFPKPVLDALLSFPAGTKFGKFTLDWGSQLGLSIKAMFEVAAQSGLRLDECTTNRDDWNLSKMSRASLKYFIRGQYITDPSRQQLRSMTEKDAAVLTTATSKTDFTGAIHGGKVIVLPYRKHHTYNGCRAMVDLEMAFPVRGEERSRTPLFTDDESVAVKASFVRTLLHHMLVHEHMHHVLPADDLRKFSFHSFRKFYATCLSKAGADRERIQSLCRWADPASVDLYDMLGVDDHAALADKAYAQSPMAITPAILENLRVTQLDDNDMMAQWCSQCHVDLSDDALDWE